MLKSTTDRYGAIPITIHWISAILILILLGSGFQAANAMDSVAKGAFLRVHIPMAIAILLLTLLRIATPPAQYGFSLPLNNVGGSDAGCLSTLVQPAVYAARISVSSSLLAATMNQKSSLREVPNFVSRVLTANSSAFGPAGSPVTIPFAKSCCISINCKSGRP